MLDLAPAGLDRLSLNQMTLDQWGLEEVIDGCVRAGVEWIGPWRHKVQEVGLEEAARMVADSGLKVSSYCRGGFFPVFEHEIAERRDDNRRAIDEAAALGTDVLVLVCGASIDKDIESARRMVVEGIAELVPYARDAGVRLGIEPLHPMFAGDRSVVVTLGQANDMASNFSSADVGVVVDVYHVWWDPALQSEIERCGKSGKLFAFHVCDWKTPTKDLLLDRGLPGEGCIDIRQIRAWVEATGFRGPIEVEIFSEAYWAGDQAELLERVTQSYLSHV